VLKAYEISKGELYQRGQFLNYPLETKLSFIQLYRIDIIINLWHTADDELEPHLWKYIHRYFPDSEKEIDTEWLLDIANRIACWIDVGHVVLVHCYGGNNRSGLISALVLRELYDVTGLQAMRKVQSIKTRALHNVLYQEFLRSLPRIDQ